MEKEIVEEIKKKCSFRERILLKLFGKMFVKVYNIARIEIINNLLI